MRRLRIGIIDLVARGETHSLYARLMHANLASIMPQVAAVWCEEAGHDVRLVCYTGLEDLPSLLPPDVDIVFISAFTQAAQLSYALSNLFRQRGAITVLGGPHARCYPQDARRYFDYVLGLTDREVLQQVLEDGRPHRPLGLHLEARQQPTSLPSLRRRWKYIEPILARAPLLKIVPIIGSFGCPYACPFCIDSTISYQPLDPTEIEGDLRFLRERMKRPQVVWHDPNFGVHFDDCLDTIERAVPPGSIEFVAESSLALLSEPHLARLARNGFKAILPGVESWFALGGKSRTGKRTGDEKVKQVAEHVKLVLRYIPYVQVNFVLGMDCDQGPAPFELGRDFVDLVPAAFPGYSLLSAFGRAAPLNLEYHRAGRVLDFPFHLLDNNHAMNVRPLHYSWPEFYDGVIRVTSHAFSWPAIGRRFQAASAALPRWMNLVRAVSSEGFGRLRYYRTVRNLLQSDRGFRRYYEQETDVLPPFFERVIRRDLGPFWDWLPEGALRHDPAADLEEAPQEAAAPEAAAALPA